MDFLKKRLSNLLTVKSIVTILLTMVFSFLSVRGLVTTDQFLTVFTVVIICREMFMTAFRSLAASKNIIIAADMPGKIKTVAQMIGIMAMLLVPDLVYINSAVAMVFFIIGFACLAFGTLMAILSCVLYICKYPSVFKEDK